MRLKTFRTFRVRYMTSRSKISLRELFCLTNVRFRALVETLNFCLVKKLRWNSALCCREISLKSLELSRELSHELSRKVRKNKERNSRISLALLLHNTVFKLFLPFDKPQLTRVHYEDRGRISEVKSAFIADKRLQIIPDSLVILGWCLTAGIIKQMWFITCLCVSVFVIYKSLCYRSAA